MSAEVGELSAAARGRADLEAWQAAQPPDLYADDAEARALIGHHGLGAYSDRFHAAGRAVAGPLDRAVRENNLHRNLPVLDDWDGVGRYTARVSHHPSWREAGRLIYGTGLLGLYAESPPPHRSILTLFYLTAQAGEAGHNCPLACDAGAIRSLMALGTPEQKERYLGRLLDPDFDRCYTASQFLTEVQGGSDVGANALQARPLGGGEAGSRWLLSGEKWFCSNADADVFLLTARVGPPEAGTAGLGLFLVPRLRSDGRPNGFRLRRLKDKLGTRSMASGEIDFAEAEAEALGPVSQGFKTVIQLVITTSRLYNAFGCAAHARRAWAVASTYAQHRRAFGRPIEGFPAVAESLAWMRADAAAMLAGGLWLAELAEKIEQRRATEEEQAFFRVAVNLHKMRTAQLAHDCVNRGIEVLGGNGAIESFSVLPRLLRDNVVYENWEGTHNVLRAQILRDVERMGGLLGGFFGLLRARLGSALVDPEARFADLLLRHEPELVELGFRPLAERLATLVMLGGLRHPGLEDIFELSLRHLRPPRLEPAHLERVRRLLR